MRIPLPLVLFTLASVPCVRAQGPSAQGITPAEYAARREALAAAIDSGVVLAFGAPDPTRIDRWTQLPAFRYLTGFLEPNAAFLLVKRGGKTEGTLFTATRDPRRMLYEGFPPDSATVARETGLQVRALPALRPLVDSLVGLGLPIYDLGDYASADVAQTDSLTRGWRFLTQLRAEEFSHPPVIRDAHVIVDSLRAKKSPAEMALLRRSIDITVASLKHAIQAVKPGMWEYQAEAMIEGGFRSAGADGTSFGSIIGSGPNSTQYHYEANNKQMASGEVVVMDVGAEYRGYAADVTRTVPVNGRFTPEQRAVYQLVRDAQAAAEKVAKPGASWQAWSDTARAVEARGLAKLGLIESVDATFDPPWADTCKARPQACKQAFLYMAHGLGHGIGLEVHDAPRRAEKFEVGQVFTIEPGVYVSTKLLDMLPDTPKNRQMIAKVRKAVERYRNIGVRIEDDYVITPGGVEWLSRAPREIAEIEKLKLVSGR
ncbi:MAG TPA: aminopeptidase P N-terminal domain-containing protein [Gemmatimonadales bacterium]|nr:aminopeptidase P N-terminal domain-containing protein [Gemmatimonadales bacterium]